MAVKEEARTIHCPSAPGPGGGLEPDAEKLKFGREFHGIMAVINKAGSANAAALDALETFSATHAGTPHGRAARHAHDRLSANPNETLSPDSCFDD